DNGDWSGSFWEPDAKDKTPWVEIDLGKVVKISQAIIYERGNAVRSFELQNMAGDQWKTFYTGKTIGSKLEIKLPKVTTQKVRLVLKDFSKVPGIYELVLL
ncbi:MAG: discoidin domain-containing protein, partial [Mariniphaga sp.]|nr:discoidin domain-containing protein [Mariniphaga sp.]